MIKANFKAYNNYVTDSVYQWDLNQDLVISGLNLTVAPEVHFSNANMDKAIVAQSKISGGVVTVRIPNSILQSPLTIIAYIGVYEDTAFRIIETVEIPVKRKAKPADYKIETATGEIYSFNRLEYKLSNVAVTATVQVKDNIDWDTLNKLDAETRLKVLEAGWPTFTDEIQAVYDSLTDGGSADLVIEGTTYVVRRVGDVTDMLMIKDGKLVLCRKNADDGVTPLGEYQFETVSCSNLATVISYVVLPCTLDDLINGIVERVSYAGCGAYLDGTHDDYEAMYRAHYIGDLCSCDVIQHGGTIYKARSGWIYIYNHSVDLSGSTIFIDGYNRYGWYWIGGQTYYYNPGSPALSDVKEYATEWPSAETGYRANGLFVFTRPEDTTRWNSGTITKEDRKEIVRHGMDGRVYSPVIDDATDTTTFLFTRYPATQVVFKGCTIDFDVAFATVAIYFMRCERSNVVIRDFIINPNRRTTQNIGYRGSVFTLNNCADILLENIRGINIAGRPRPEYPRGVAGYILSAVCILDLTVRDCNLLGYWGCVGLNGAKEITFEGCELNRVDVHDYFSNLTIHNCRIYGQTINVGYGKGAINISDCHVLTDWVHQIVNLRCDYGRYFEGEINLNNITAVYTGTQHFDIVSGITMFSAESAAGSGLFMKRYPTISVSNVIIRMIGDNYIGYVFRMPPTLEDTISIDDKRKVVEYNNVTVYDEGNNLLDIGGCNLGNVVKCSAQKIADLESRIAALGG